MPPNALRVFAIAAVAAVCLALNPAGAVAQPNDAATPAGNPARGKTLFLNYGCYECHGTAGQGNFTTAPRLAPHPLPYAALVSYIRKPGGSMPSFSANILPDRDAVDIYAYLSSISAAKTPAQIPLLAGANTKPK
jgi:mono/diheme cytochrome c family protein